MNRNTMPVVTAGLVGLVSGLLGVALSVSTFGAVAGVLALAAAFGSVRIARQLDEQNAVRALIEDELRKVRLDAEEAQSRVHQLEATMIDPATVAVEPEDAFYEDNDSDPLTDADTGLFSESFFLVALESRVAAARRHLRPVAVVLLQVMEGLPASEARPTGANVVADAINGTLREADTACRLRNGDFALLLEDTPENGAIWTVERIRRRLMADTTTATSGQTALEAGEVGSGAEPATAEPIVGHSDKLTVWAGVACYPAHAFTDDELIHAASSALRSAQEWRQDRIEVAVPAPD